MDLTDALDLGEREVVALVGGGGKTTAMYRLCREAAARGRRGGGGGGGGGGGARGPPGGRTPPPLAPPDESDLLRAVRPRLATAGSWVIAATGLGSKERLLPISNDMVTALAAEPEIDLLALEAHASALRPFRPPAEHEPAVPEAATLVIAVVGADVFGRPLDPACVHRPE